MKMYYTKFAYHSLYIALFVYVLFIISSKMVYGVMDILDIVVAILLMTFGSLSIITDRLVELVKLNYRREIEKIETLRQEERKNTPTGVCPECQGKGVCVWSDNEVPMTCWNCSGSGKV